MTERVDVERADFGEPDDAQVLTRMRLSRPDLYPALAHADELQAQAILDYLEHRAAADRERAARARTTPRWLAAVEAVHGANRHVATFAVDAAVLVAIGFAAGLALTPKRGEAHWPRWNESLIGEDPGVLESVSLSLGERVRVRASVLRN